MTGNKLYPVLFPAPGDSPGIRALTKVILVFSTVRNFYLISLFAMDAAAPEGTPPRRTGTKKFCYNLSAQPCPEGTLMRVILIPCVLLVRRRLPMYKSGPESSILQNNEYKKK